ncbi:MAG TPA: hypothetical protein VNN79_24410 [Actinomycetota bacterium]|nr:hypothetical protein [Actinomycetota bacterium]
MPGPERSTITARPAALASICLVTAAVLLAGCTDGSKPAAQGTPTSGAPATSSLATPGTTSPGPTPSGKPTKSPKPPKPPAHRGPFAFRVDHVGNTLTTRKLGPAKIHRATRETVRAVRKRFDQLFRMTFVDPAHWKSAKYGEAFQDFFGGQVRQLAAGRRQKLTLGPDAGKRFVSVGQPTGRLKVNVLIGSGGAPVTAVVHAAFNEKAKRTNGGTTVVVVDGAYYLSPSKHGWVIDGFRVGRHDHPL